jgi:hypothetical protein
MNMKLIDSNTLQVTEFNKTPRKARSDAKTDAVDLAEMNAAYAVTKIGGKTRVMSLEESATFPGCKVPVFSSINDFKAFHLKRKKSVSDGQNTRQVGMGQWWINHPERRQYDGVVYAPGGAPDHMFNLWTGFGCTPIEGECGSYLDHLHNNICGGNREHFEYLFNWMAYAVQYPERPGGVAVVMRGREGTGKGVAAKEFGKLFGSHFRHVCHAKHLTGHFNAHLQQCSVLFADEAFFAGDRSHESPLKALITEETMLIEPKGVDSYAVQNCVHLSNADWVIPTGADARRYFVLNVGDARMQDGRYFHTLNSQMNNGGREALLYRLQNTDLTSFDVRKVPQTEALAQQKAHSRRGIDRLIENVSHSGVLPAAHTNHPNIAVTTGEENGDGFYPRARALAPELKFDSSIIIHNHAT